MKSGLPLALLSVGALAVAGALTRRGSRSSDPDDARLQRFLRIVSDYEGRELYGETELEMERRLQAEGFEMVGSGGARLVFRVGPDQIAKVDMDPGAVANDSESDFYRWNKDNTGLLNPILSSHLDGRVLVMPRAERVFSTSVPKRYARMLRTAKAEVADLPFGEDRVDHEHDFNWGLVNGVLQLIDYNT
jgi:hypothetical protein